MSQRSKKRKKYVWSPEGLASRKAVAREQFFALTPQEQEAKIARMVAAQGRYLTSNHQS
jgi:hypothetical protein